jgi:hypothetical protein
MLCLKQSKSVKESKTVEPPQGYDLINVLPWKRSDSPYYEFSPYYLRTDDHSPFWPAGVLFENAWQGSKVYPRVYDIRVKPNFRSGIVWWSYDCGGSEVHLNDNEITPEYFHWRESVMSCPNPIRYPNGYAHRREAAFSVTFENGVENRRDYITARRELYATEYVRLIRELPVYWGLIRRLQDGQNLCITEVDVPSNDKTGLYANVDDENMYHPSIEGLMELMDDPTHSFGHGLCLALSLLMDLEN